MSPRTTKAGHATCVIERRMRVSVGMVDLFTGRAWSTGERIEVRACGVPLFAQADRERGVCRGCASGWATDGNAPTDAGLAQLKAILDPAPRIRRATLAP